MKIYHNPRCSKSRQALELLNDSGKEFQVIEYFKDSPSKEELEEIIKLLEISPEQLIRKKEQIFIDQIKGKSFSDEEYIQMMINHPKLIERPIVVYKGKAAIGRPLENIQTLLDS